MRSKQKVTHIHLNGHVCISLSGFIVFTNKYVQEMIIMLVCHPVLYLVGSTLHICRNLTVITDSDFSSQLLFEEWASYSVFYKYQPIGLIRSEPSE